MGSTAQLAYEAIVAFFAGHGMEAIIAGLSGQREQYSVRIVSTHSEHDYMQKLL